MENTAYSYVRFSTKGQIAGDSLARQLAKAREYAKKHDLTLDESSYQDLGISAFRGKNATEGALAAFLQAVDDGAIPSNVTLLIENFDRLSRAQVQDALELFLGITKRGVTIVTLIDEQVYNRKTINANWTQLIITLATMARAHEESAVKSMRTRSGKLAAIGRGVKLGRHPFWMTLEKDKRTFTVIEEKADIVRKCFQLRLEGVGSLRIAKYLNENCGFKYGSSQVVRLLQNPAVVGTRISQVGHEPLLEYYPQIVDKPLFYDVQRLMTTTPSTKLGRRPADEPNLFTGIARCAKCNGSMRFFRESKSVNQRYIRCLSAVTHAGCTAEGYVNYDAFEKEVIGWLLLDQDEEFVSLLERKPSVVSLSSAEVVSLKEQQSRLLDLLTQGLQNPALVAERLNALEGKIKGHEQIMLDTPPEDKLFAEKAWALVERHDDAQLGDDKDVLSAVRRELKAAFQRSLEVIRVHPEKRVKDTVRCRISVRFRGYQGEPEHTYVRPALNNVRGKMNGA